jgi:death on curing protein
MDEPTWVPRVVVDAVHFSQLQEHGGSHGVRDAAAIDTALGRPMNRFAYMQGGDIADCAAAYMYGIAMGHGYVDGNKRTAVAVALIFLDLNGYELQRTDEELEDTVIAMVEHDISDSDLAKWIRDALVRTPPPGQMTVAVSPTP